MKNETSRIMAAAEFIACTAILVTSTGCISERSDHHHDYVGRPRAHVQTVVVVQDDYDYYPGYEVYYSRTRHEYVYLDGRSWVRRSEPRGVTVDVLLRSPSVTLDFHDSPEQHHSSVVRSYPKNWKRAEKRHDERRGRNEEKGHGRRD